MTPQRPKKKLRLTIEVEDIWADDLDESAEIMRDAVSDYSIEDARLDVVTEEWFNSRCFVVLTTIPGEKCMNDEFEHIGREATIVAVDTSGGVG
jgi:hypothetical protein